MRFMTMMYAEVLPNTSGVKFGLRHLVFDGWLLGVVLLQNRFKATIIDLVCGECFAPASSDMSVQNQSRLETPESRMFFWV